MKLRSLLGSLLAVALLASLVGCVSGSRTRKPNFDPVAVRFVIEARANEAAVPLTLPISGTRISVLRAPVVTEFDLVGAEVIETDLGQAVVFLLTSPAARDMYRFSVANQGRRLVATLNGVALGARLIERPITEGALLVYLEMPDSELAEVVRDINLTSQDLQEQIARARR